ncbi:hypothetical protein ACXWTF_12525 [Thiomicrolovo sp. ZZH C-3]
MEGQTQAPKNNARDDLLAAITSDIEKLPTKKLRALNSAVQALSRREGVFMPVVASAYNETKNLMFIAQEIDAISSGVRSHMGGTRMSFAEGEEVLNSIPELVNPIKEFCDKMNGKGFGTFEGIRRAQRHGKKAGKETPEEEGEDAAAAPKSAAGKAAAAAKKTPAK